MKELLFLGAAVLAAAADSPADNQLSEKEKKEGWILLFDGKTLDGWMTSGRKPSKTPVQDGAINPHRSGDYMMVYDRVFSDFVLSLDFKISERCNSGVFVRTSSLTPLPGRDVGYNGLEIAIDDTTTAGYTDTGALYDLARPRRNAMKPAGEWNRLAVTCDGPKVTVELNGELVTEADLSLFAEPNKRPDGTAHKFDVAYKEHPRAGYIGLQDHGSDCWFKNIKLKPITREKTASEGKKDEVKES
jgi:hypothetical protein